MPQVRVGARSDVGHVRSLNEDAIVVGLHVWAVADGMGGHAAGDVASLIMQRELKALDRADLSPEDLVGCIERANRLVVQHAVENPTSAGLGTTVTGVAEVSIGGAHHWAIFNVGDSRVYRFFDGQLARATVDHSEVEELILAGRITEEQARTHPLRNVITRSVGQSPPPVVDLWVLPQSAGERFLICSDGLTGEVGEDAISRALAAFPAEQAAEALVDQALAGFGRDNVSVIVLDVDQPTDDMADEQTNPRISTPAKEAS